MRDVSEREVKEWMLAFTLALLAIFAWRPVCWALGKLGGWL